MPSLSVRNLDADVIGKLKQRAFRHNRSTESEVREILRQAVSHEAPRDFDDLAAEFRALLANRRHTPAETLLQESRDER